MLIGLATLAALLSVPLLGGRIMALADLRFRAAWLAPLAIGMQILIINVIPENAGTLHRVIHLASYAVLAAFVFVNFHRVPFLWLIGLGGAINLTAIAANDGVMPASASALRAAGVEQTPGEFINSTTLPDANVQFLGDVFAVPSWMPIANVFSIGDALIVLGALLAFHAICRSRPAVAIERRLAHARAARAEATAGARSTVSS